MSSIRGSAPAPSRPTGKDIDSLGPSDSSDSGSDVQDEHVMPAAPDRPDEFGAVVADLSSDTDSAGSGERAFSTGERQADGADIMPDRIIEFLEADRDPADRLKSLEAADLPDDGEDETDSEES